MMDATNKVALITGGGSGIGAATAVQLTAAGVSVVLADRNVEAASAGARHLGAEAVAIDVSDAADWARVVADIGARHGQLDILVNSAGIFEIATIADTSEALFMRTVAVNQLGTFLGMQAVAPLMAQGGGGAIVNLSSAAGLIGTPGSIAYSASKWAVRGMTKVAATELAAQGIRVNSVHPGRVDTPMLRELKGDRASLGVPPVVPLGRGAQAEEVARMIVFLALGGASFSTGSEFVCDGGLTAL